MSISKSGNVEPPVTEARASAMDSPGRSPADLPDRWCFGLSHPYIQRLIFLAGDAEQSALPTG